MGCRSTYAACFVDDLGIGAVLHAHFCGNSVFAVDHFDERMMLVGVDDARLDFAEAAEDSLYLRLRTATVMSVNEPELAALRNLLDSADE